jgi:glycosyltransferase involved in cell wall biosynthesis
VDCERYRVVAESIPEPDVVLVTGSFDWEPNRIGLRWFVRDVIPALHRMTPRAPIQVRIAGRMDAVLAAQLDAIPGVQAFPNVPDMRDQLARATVVAAPVLVSSGTRLRILEGWAAGRPVVTTPEGAFGLEYLDDDDIVVRRGAENFARAIVELLADPERRSALRRAGLRRAAIYDWRRVADALLDAAGRLGCESTPSD